MKRSHKGGGHNPGRLMAEEEGEGERKRRGEQEGEEMPLLPSTCICQGKAM